MRIWLWCGFFVVLCGAFQQRTQKADSGNVFLFLFSTYSHAASCNAHWQDSNMRVLFVCTLWYVCLSPSVHACVCGKYACLVEAREQVCLHLCVCVFANCFWDQDISCFEAGCLKNTENKIGKAVAILWTKRMHVQLECFCLCLSFCGACFSLCGSVCACVSVCLKNRCLRTGDSV